MDESQLTEAERPQVMHGSSSFSKRDCRRHPAYGTVEDQDRAQLSSDSAERRRRRGGQRSSDSVDRPFENLKSAAETTEVVLALSSQHRERLHLLEGA
eukprot:3522441-Pleurochrysis_carterae.AAC.3